MPGGTPVTGGIRVSDSRGTPSIISGDTGPEKVNTHLFKGKLGYDITSNLLAVFTVAYEDRSRNQSKKKTYLQDEFGQAFYGAPLPTCNSIATCATPGVASLDGTRFDVNQRGFGGSRDSRETLNLGLRINGELAPLWNIDAAISHFNVLKDERATAFFGRNDPANTGAGQLQDFKQFDWLDADIKIGTPAVNGNDKLAITGGYHFDEKNLKFRQYNLVDFDSLTRGTLQANRNNQGRTTTHAFFTQAALHFLPDWDLTAGARWEWWSTSNGVVGSLAVPDRNLFRTSPKVSLGYEPNDWKFRYSFGRAHRFPVIAELFQSLSNPTSILEANASLKPENGVHHNFMIEHGLPKGYVRVNVFRDEIKNDIQSVRSVSGSITRSGFQNIGETSATGVELIFDQRNILGSKFDFMFNGTWMNAKIEKGQLIAFTDSTGKPSNFDQTGLQRIRMPHWRANFFTTYHATPAWDISFSGRYTSDSFNDRDNKDFKNNVFGSQTDFFFLDFKTSYRHQFASGIKSRFSFGISNINNDKAFVFHPYPQRTFLVEAAFSY